MTDDISRRGFLKGLMAAAALVVVAPQLLVEEVPVTDFVTAGPAVEAGELWFLRRGTWRLAGKVVSWSIARDALDITTLHDIRPKFIPAPEMNAEAELIIDTEGLKILRSVFEEGISALQLGAAGGTFRCDQAWLRGVDLEVTDKYLRASTNLVLQGPVVRTA